MKILRLLGCCTAALLLMGSLTACNGGSATPSPGTSGGGGGETAPPDFDGTVSMFIWEKATDDDLAFIKSFEEKYGGKVTQRLTTWGEMSTAVITAMSGDEGPDLVWTHEGDYIKKAVNNIIQPIDSYLDLNDGTWDAYSQKLEWDGKHYVPVPKNRVGENLIYFNQTQFENNGVTTPKEYYDKGEWTYDNFVKCAREMTLDTNHDGTIDMYGWGSWRMFDFVYANGGSIVKRDGATVTPSLNDPKTVYGLQFLKDAYQKYKFAKPDGNMTFETDMQKGKVAMLSENSHIGTLLKRDNMTDKWDIVPFPLAPENKEKKNIVTGAFWGLAANAKNVHGAVAYMTEYAKYLTSKEDEILGKTFTPEQIAVIHEARQNPFDAHIEANMGVWENSQWNFIFGISGTQDVSQAVAQWTPILETQIKKTLEGGNNDEE